MPTLSIDYPERVLRALQQDSVQFEQEARLLLALKLYETGRLTTGLAAQVAGLSRIDFILSLGQFGLSPFSENADELADDLANARSARPRFVTPRPPSVLLE